VANNLKEFFLSFIVFRARLESFGFHAIVVDGHDVAEIVKAFDEVKTTKMLQI